MAPFRVSEIDDRTIRARDGFHFVMAIKAGNHIPCRTCGLKVSVPECKTGEIRCDYCAFKQRNPKREFGGFWPLSEILIEHLKKIDPNRDGHLKAAFEQDLAHERKDLAQRRTIRNHVEAATYDDKYQIFDTPLTGYTKAPLVGTSINGKLY